MKKEIKDSLLLILAFAMMGAGLYILFGYHGLFLILAFVGALFDFILLIWLLTLWFILLIWLLTLWQKIMLMIFKKLKKESKELNSRLGIAIQTTIVIPILGFALLAGNNLLPVTNFISFILEKLIFSRGGL